jgi:hypothetical protein
LTLDHLAKVKKKDTIASSLRSQLAEKDEELVESRVENETFVARVEILMKERDTKAAEVVKVCKGPPSWGICLI